MLLPVSWLQIKLPAARADVDSVAEALATCGALSVTIEGANDEMRLQAAAEPAPLWRENRVTGLFRADVDTQFVLAAVREALGRRELAHRIDRLEDADWSRAWMAHYRPVRVGDGLWVVPSWCTPPDSRAVNVILDPGLAFGTGTHPSTALCLAWLARQPLAGARVIDYGCGSGILAIAALKLGATSAVGVDTDAQALAASRDNAVRNRVADRYAACAPAALPAGVAADVLAANILASTLVELAPALAARVKPGGRLALSGILSEQAAGVQRAYAPHFAFETAEREGWVLLSGPRTG